MKIFIDIGHPAHVHYFKNFIKIMRDKGHKFFIIARGKPIIKKLLESYGIEYVDRGVGRKTYLGKVVYFIKASLLIFFYSVRFKPDLYLSQGGVYTSIVSLFFFKPNIVLEDTEKAVKSHLIAKLTNSLFIVPYCFSKYLSHKKIKYKGIEELMYLHSNHFTANNNVFFDLDITKNDKYVLLRFVSWDAHHDVGQSGLDNEIKIQLLKELKKHCRVFISSEGELSEEFRKYELDIVPDKVHDVLAFADLFISEGATMASESALLGTPTIFVNSLQLGNILELEKYGLVYNYKNSVGVIEKALEIIKISNLNEEFQKKRKNFLSEKIDVTAFLVWFIENHPNSLRIIKENPEYQNRFK